MKNAVRKDGKETREEIRRKNKKGLENKVEEGRKEAKKKMQGKMEHGRKRMHEENESSSNWKKKG